MLLPADIRGALATEIERLRHAARGVAWVAPDNLHVTLKFLGEVASPRLAGVADALAAVAAAGADFTLEVAGLGAFPTPTRVRVVWAGLGEGREPLVSLATRVDDALSGLGFQRESRPFAGHVTLGRVREPRHDEALAAALSAAPRFGRFRVNRLALMRSDLSPRGARYTPLETWALAGGPGRGN